MARPGEDMGGGGGGRIMPVDDGDVMVSLNEY